MWSQEKLPHTQFCTVWVHNLVCISQPSELYCLSPAKVQCTLNIDINSKWAGTKRSAANTHFHTKLCKTLNSITYVHIQCLANVPPASGWLLYSIAGARLVFGMVHLADTSSFWGPMHYLFSYIARGRFWWHAYEYVMHPMLVESCPIAGNVPAETNID